MTFRNSSKFKIQAADEDRISDSLLTDQIEYRRFEKLSQRVTIITILIPILIGIMIFIGYRGISEMVSQTQDTGAKELTSLSQSLESTISNLSIKQAKLEEMLAGKLVDLEKMETTVQDSLKQMEATVQDNIKQMEATVQNSLKQMETTVQDNIKKTEVTVQDNVKKTETSLAEIQAGKADKKDIAGNVSGMDSKLVGIQKDLKIVTEKLNTDIKSIDKKFSDEFAKSLETVNSMTTSVAECQADIGLLSAEKADKKATEIALKNHEKRLQDQTSQLLRNLESKMESLNTSIAELEKIKSALEKNHLPPAPKKPQAGSPSSSLSSSKGSGKSEPGIIYEEKIQD
jgi:DNA anti-recombination protein RmuC